MEFNNWVIFILTFVTINLFNMSDKTTPRPTTQPALTEEKGRTIPNLLKADQIMILKINMLTKKTEIY
jgi:hypothetical protein